MVRGLVQNIDGLVQLLVDRSKFDITMTTLCSEYLIIKNVFTERTD